MTRYQWKVILALIRVVLYLVTKELEPNAIPTDALALLLQTNSRFAKESLKMEVIIKEEQNAGETS